MKIKIKIEKSRCFSLVLYPCEDENDLKTLEYIIDNFEYAYIEHNRDTWEEDTEEHKKGDKKKDHTHVLIYLKNPRTVESMKKELEINYIETCNFYAYTRYLIHLGYPGKFQYLSDEIITNIPIRICNALKRDFISEEQDSRILLNFLFNRNFTTFRELTVFAMENDCLKELKSKTYFYKQFCDEYK